MSEGKEHKRYEFGTKVSITTIQDKDTESRYKEIMRQRFRKRAGIEPVIGHLKSDHRLNRGYLKGFKGDQINILMAAAAFNLGFFRVDELLCTIIIHDIDYYH